MRVRISACQGMLVICSVLGACTSADPPSDGGAGSGGTGAHDAPSVSDVMGPNGCYAEPNPSPAFPASRDPDLLARAATVVGSCMEDDGIVRHLGYMWNADANPEWFYNRFVLQATCLANARCGCKAVEACLGSTLKRRDAPGSCNPCSGSVFRECGPGYEATFDCARFGFSCDPLAVCSATPAVACDPTTFVSRCDATGSPEVCRQKAASSVARLTKCSTLGLVCQSGQCQGTGDTCTGGRPSSEGDLRYDGLGCMGTRLEACVGGKKTTLDCAERGPGFSCQSVATAAGTHYFCGLASECAPAAQGPTATSTSTSEDVTCDGATVVICNAGRIDRIDCTALGFTGCEVNPANRAYGCVPGPTF